jgi:hypothetical protein
VRLARHAWDEPVLCQKSINEREKDLDKKLKIALICLAFVCACAYGVVRIEEHNSDKRWAHYEAAQNDAVNQVKANHFTNFPDIDIGALLDYYFGNTSYTVTGEEGEMLVLFTGVSLDNMGIEHNSHIFFQLNGDACTLETWLFDDTTLSQEAISQSIGVIAQVYRNNH